MFGQIAIKIYCKEQSGLCMTDKNGIILGYSETKFSMRFWKNTCNT